MADGNGAAVDVDLCHVPAELLADRKRLGGECLVGFDQVELLERPARFLQASLVADTGAMPMIAGSTPALASC